MISILKKRFNLFFYYKQGSKLVKHACFWHYKIDYIVLNSSICHLYFSDEQGISYEFYKVTHFQKNSENRENDL
jgi:hypothetical protein